MTDNKHSLKIKTSWFEATAEGYGVAALLLIAAAAVALKVAGWW